MKTVALGLLAIGVMSASICAQASPFDPKEPKALPKVEQQIMVQDAVPIPELMATKRSLGVWSAYMQGRWVKVGERIDGHLIKQIGSMYVRFSDGTVVRLLGTSEEKAKVEVRYEK